MTCFGDCGRLIVGSDGEGEDDGAGHIGGVGCETRVAAAEEICVHVCVTLRVGWEWELEFSSGCL